MANYLDSLDTFLARAVVVRADTAYDMALRYNDGLDITDEVNEINWNTTLSLGSADTTQDETLRLVLLTLLVNNFNLFNIPTPVGVYNLYQPISPTSVATVPFNLVTGDILSNASAAAQFALVLYKTGGTMTGPLLIDPTTRIDSTGVLNIGTSTATTTTIGRVGQNVAMPGTITLATWGGVAIPIAKGGTGQVALGTALQVLRTNAAANATEWATIATGDVTGPGSSIDNAIARFDGVTGKIIQSSGVVVSDGNGIQGAATLSMNGSTSGFTLITPSAIAGSNTQTLQAATGTIALLENRLDAFAATTSAQLATVISDETGTGVLVFATSPTLTTPVIGAATGTSLVLSGAITSGVASSAAGTVVLRNATNAFTQTIRGTNPAASVIYDLPTTAPTVGQYLSASAPSAGVVTLSWGTITALVNPMSALGDLISGAAAGAPTALVGDTSNTRKFLRSLSVASVATAPVWDTLLAADIPTIAQSQVSGLVTALTNKLGTGLTDGYFFVGNAANAAVGVAMSQDGTIDNTGALTIADGVVTFAKMQDITFQTLVGRWSAGDGPPQEISIGSGLSLSGAGVLSASGGGTGDVVGPASATDNAIARFDTTTGKLIQNSAVLIADTTGVISGTQGITFSGTTSGTTSLVATAIAGTTILTMPAATDTLVGKATTDTFTNKTLSASSNVLGGVTMTLGSDGTGDVYYRNAGGVLTRLGVGSNGDVLTLAAGLPSWAAGGGGASLAATLAIGNTTGGTNIEITSGDKINFDPVGIQYISCPSGIIDIYNIDTLVSPTKTVNLSLSTESSDWGTFKGSGTHGSQIGIGETSYSLVGEYAVGLWAKNATLQQYFIVRPDGVWVNPSVAPTLGWVLGQTASGLDYIDPSTFPGGGAPGGSDTELQYNNASAFGGITGATSNGTIVTLTAPQINGALLETSSTVGYVWTATDTAGAGAWAAAAGSGANTALSNLAAVSINASLIPQTTLDLGAAATAWRSLYLYGSGTFGSHSIQLTGTPTGNRVLTIPDATDTMAVLGTAQTFTAAKTFNDQTILLRNPANTFSYTLVHGAIAANRTLNLPVITATDTLATLGLGQTFTAANTFSLVGSTGVAITISGAGSSTNAGLTFTSSSRGWINMGTSGDAVAAPTLTTARSQGTKIVLYPLFVASTTADYAIGLETNAIWFGLPDSTRFFYWYQGATRVMTLSANGNMTLVQRAAATGALVGFTFTGAVTTNQTASTEIQSALWNCAGRQWAAGNITTQREFLIAAPAYTFVGNASTITTAATFAIAGAPTISGGTSAITNALALWVQGGKARFDGAGAWTGLPTGNAGLASGDLYVDTAANILANGDVVVGRKV